ncbi:MAG: hypothetical protein M1813_002158 [Trichoglossum hirsutum]|nr:MAG: hypothetical protein M1813_002158 [Trichoglossum hirsutum]
MSDQYDHTPFEKLGNICWVEIPATDINRAKTFYSTLFGWEFSNPSEMGVGDGPEDSYVIFHKKGTSLHGGIERVAPSDLVSPKSKQGSAVKITMTVEEVSKALEEIKKAGGEVVREKTEIGGGMGYSGLFRDTEGNINGVWSQK